MEIIPYVAGAIGFVFFIGFAYWSPMTSRLYKESFYSLCLGIVGSGFYVKSYKRDYYQAVDECYDHMKLKIKKYPQLNLIEEDESVLKNFGFTQFS